MIIVAGCCSAIHSMVAIMAMSQNYHPPKKDSLVLRFCGSIGVPILRHDGPCPNDSFVSRRAAEDGSMLPTTQAIICPVGGDDPDTYRPFAFID